MVCYNASKGGLLMEDKNYPEAIPYIVHEDHMVMQIVVHP